MNAPRRSRKRKAHAAVALAGDFTIYRATQLREELLQLAAQGAGDFDLSEVSELDSSGLQLLGALRAAVAAAGGSARFLAASASVREACALCGLEHWLAAEPTPEAA